MNTSKQIQGIDTDLVIENGIVYLKEFDAIYEALINDKQECLSKKIIKRVGKPITKKSKPLTITSQQIENQLSNAQYLGVNLPCNEKLENCGYIPHFTKYFYSYIAEHDNIPTQQEWIKYYCTHNETSIEITGNNVRIYKLNGDNNRTQAHIDCDILPFKARLLRVYPSLVREFHFYLMASERQELKNKVKYSYYYDVYGGVDILVAHKPDMIKIGLDVNTRRANEFREKKYNSRHSNNGLNKGIHYITLNLDDGKHLGNDNTSFILYPNSYVDKIFNYF